MVLSTVRESVHSIPLAMAEEDMETTSESEFDDAPPVHPVPTMQGAFEESMAETMNGEDQDEAPDKISKADSVARRKLLLEQEHYERTVAGRWKQKPGERFHPLWKLVAQISFGMHLLQQGLAKSDEEVLKILQTHVDEIDGFLERTTEDFDLAQGDINERIRYLKLPLEHGEVFDQMLLDRAFRTAIVEGNEKIEHIIDRTSAAMNDALKDVQKGLDATRELAKYMTRVDKMWEDRTEEHDSVYLAMIGNTEGWTRAFLTLQSKGNHLRKALLQLGGIVAEMQRRAGAASRKNLVPSRSATGRYTVNTEPESARNTPTPPRSPLKPLPTAPDPSTRKNSQKHISHSSKSVNASPHVHQSPRGNNRTSSRKESLTSPRVVDIATSPRIHGYSPRSPGSSRYGRTPTPEHHFQGSDHDRAKSPQLGLGIVPTSNYELHKSGRSARSPELHKAKKSPEPRTKATWSPDLQRASKDHEANPSGLRNAASHRETRSPDPNRSVVSPEPRQWGVSSPEATKERSPISESSQHTPGDIMASMSDASKASMSDTVTRRKSLTERTRSILGKKGSVKRHSPGNSDEISSQIHLPYKVNDYSLQQPLDTSDGLQAKDQTISPLLRRLSSHRKYDSFGMIVTSPKSPQFSAKAPSIELSRSQLENSVNNEPEQSLVAPLNLLPAQPEFSPLEASFRVNDVEGRGAQLNKPNTSDPTSVMEAKPPKADRKTESSAAHPLLQEEHHARFNARTVPGPSGEDSSRDLPLRHYHGAAEFAQSNPDLTRPHQPEGNKTPKRSSSFIHTPKEFHITPATQESPQTRQGSSSDQVTPNASTANLLTRPTNLPLAKELGVHPAHRPQDSPSALGTTPSPGPSTVSSTPEQGATPPPISTGPSHPTSPPTRFAQSPGPRTKSPLPNTNITSDSSTSTSTQLPAGDPKQMPFYLNPASSSALLEFLQSTPPPSPPHSARRTDQVPPPAASTTDFSYQQTDDRANATSPPPPGPGRSRFGLWSASTSDLRSGNDTNGIRNSTQKKGLGWKKMFGGERQPREKKERKEKSGKKFIQWGRDPPPNEDDEDQIYALQNGRTIDREKDRDGGFMGVGRDGVWISRKNFVRN